MAVHDWRLVDPGIFHAFHTLWISEINLALNGGLLPSGYYALPEQHAGQAIADVLTLHASTSDEPSGLPPDTGGVAIAQTAPRTRLRQTIEAGPAQLRRTLAIRHISGHRLVAMIEILSPGNKDRARHLADFVSKAVEALDAGINLLVIDLFAPSSNDPHGIHSAIRQRLEDSDEAFPPPANEPLVLAAYAAKGARAGAEAFIEHLNTGSDLPEMPLFLRPGRYVNVPLEKTYVAAFTGMPMFWRNVLQQGRV